MIHVGLVGCGYWGPKLVRNFQKTPGCRLVAVADLDPGKLESLRRSYPGLHTTRSGEALIDSPELDAVVIATPISTHFSLARRALLKGKHVLVEKPLTQNPAEAEELVQLARLTNDRVLMVDHTFIYTGAVRKIRELIESGELGEIYYYDSVRVNLGLFQHDVNVLWDLAPHDFSLMLYLVGKQPVRVAATGIAPVRWKNWNLESVAHVTVDFHDGTLAHFHLNWLSPVKVRKTLIGGSRKMVVYDPLDPDSEVKIYDRGVEIESESDRYRALVQYRTGDVVLPKLDQTEALENVCRHFIDSILTGSRPESDGEAGLEVVRLIMAAQESMKTRRPVDYEFFKKELLPLAANQ